MLSDADFGLSCQVFDIEQNRTVNAFAHRRNATLLSQTEAAERKRLLYVAATRAQDYLLISGQMSYSRSGQLTARGWLKQLLVAFDMLDLERKDDQSHNFNGDEIRVRMPPAPPSRQMLHGGYDTGISLLDPVQTSGESLPQPPPLLERIPPQGGLSLKHISATQFADLGGYQRSGGKEREDYRKRLLEFRRR